jgi:adenosylmethionine-8-amino-7-oxononanoate aminotransferase
MHSCLIKAKKFESVADVRVLGGIGVLEMKQAVDVASAQAFFKQRGVWIRPFGKLIYIMPPYIISEADLNKLCTSMVEYAESLCVRKTL